MVRLIMLNTCLQLLCCAPALEWDPPDPCPSVLSYYGELRFVILSVDHLSSQQYFYNYALHADYAGIPADHFVFEVELADDRQIDIYCAQMHFDSLISVTASHGQPIQDISDCQQIHIRTWPEVCDPEECTPTLFITEFIFSIP